MIPTGRVEFMMRKIIINTVIILAISGCSDDIDQNELMESVLECEAKGSWLSISYTKTSIEYGVPKIPHYVCYTYKDEIVFHRTGKPFGRK